MSLPPRRPRYRISRTRRTIQGNSNHVSAKILFVHQPCTGPEPTAGGPCRTQFRRHGAVAKCRSASATNLEPALPAGIRPRPTLETNQARPHSLRAMASLRRSVQRHWPKRDCEAPTNLRTLDTLRSVRSSVQRPACEHRCHRHSSGICRQGNITDRVVPTRAHPTFLLTRSEGSLVHQIRL